jgi:hypothetical protein
LRVPDAAVAACIVVKSSIAEVMVVTSALPPTLLIRGKQQVKKNMNQSINQSMSSSNSNIIIVYIDNTHTFAFV